ncbi:unnamed protein product [Phytophthora fragariaefolia]|uniref:Unnamed protein product n=1 Tax=Phytophthora fragariaefolia TaxID=1490495 RepID=A0A9W6YDX8_9STRA|nr:unnamed protein product [Phytophthora fragariaefolia]
MPVLLHMHHVGLESLNTQVVSVANPCTVPFYYTLLSTKVTQQDRQLLVGDLSCGGELAQNGVVIHSTAVNQSQLAALRGSSKSREREGSRTSNQSQMNQAIFPTPLAHQAFSDFVAKADESMLCQWRCKKESKVA